MSGPRPIRAPRGKELSCKNWLIEAPFRMIQNNLDPEVAQRPDDLQVARRAQLDFIDRPAGLLAEFFQHDVGRIDADRIAGCRDVVRRESPQLPDGTALRFSP